jgi:hypothetical protein
MAMVPAGSMKTRIVSKIGSTLSEAQSHEEKPVHCVVGCHPMPIQSVMIGLITEFLFL